MDRWPAFLPDRAFFLPKARPRAVLGADPPCRALGHRLAGVTGFVGEEPITELRVVTVRVEERVGPVGLGQFGVGDGMFEPAVIGLAGELQDPHRHRDRNSVGGELTHERVEPFPGRLAWER